MTPALTTAVLAAHFEYITLNTEILMPKTTYIKTPFGKKAVVRRIGAAAEYYQTTTTPNAPHGAWWVLNPQTGFVPVASNSRGLLAALTELSTPQRHHYIAPATRFRVCTPTPFRNTGYDEPSEHMPPCAFPAYWTRMGGQHTTMAMFGARIVSRVQDLLSQRWAEWVHATVEPVNLDCLDKPFHK